MLLSLARVAEILLATLSLLSQRMRRQDFKLQHSALLCMQP